jgi:hypothetical protein
MLVATGALAQTADIVGAYSITLPDDLKAVELTEENMADGLVMDMESDALHAVAYVYEPDRPTPRRWTRCTKTTWPTSRRAFTATWPSRRSRRAG